MVQLLAMATTDILHVACKRSIKMSVIANVPGSGAGWRSETGFYTWTRHRFRTCRHWQSCNMRRVANRGECIMGCLSSKDGQRQIKFVRPAAVELFSIKLVDICGCDIGALACGVQSADMFALLLKTDHCESEVSAKAKTIARRWPAGGPLNEIQEARC